MKKLFLTSGVILCMACPAFAENGPYDIKNDNVNLTNNDPATCQYPTLGKYIGDQTFYAKWAPHVFKVTYKPYEGNNYQDTGSTSVMMGNASATDQVTKATYSQSYTVYTNANFGSATVYTNVGTENEAETTGVPYARSGYNFAGWKSDYNLSSGANTPETYAEESNETVNPYNVSAADVTMYAQWTAQTYDMIYDSGAHGKDLTAQSPAHNATYTDPTKIVFDQIYTVLNFGGTANNIAGAGFTADPGYTFAGWSFSASDTAGSQTIIQPGAMSAAWTQPEGDTLYAIYSANNYTLTYDCGRKNANRVATYIGAFNANQNPKVFDKVFDTTATASVTPSDVCQLNGYTVDDDWTCIKVNASGEPIDASGNVTNNSENYVTVDYATSVVSATWGIPSHVKCSVDWTANEIGLTWKPGDGAALDQNDLGGNECTYDGTIDVPGTPTKAGYDFQGWTTNSSTPGVFLED